MEGTPNTELKRAQRAVGLAVKREARASSLWSAIVPVNLLRDLEFASIREPWRRRGGVDRARDWIAKHAGWRRAQLSEALEEGAAAWAELKAARDRSSELFRQKRK